MVLALLGILPLDGQHLAVQLTMLRMLLARIYRHMLVHCHDAEGCAPSLSQRGQGHPIRVLPGGLLPAFDL